MKRMASLVLYVLTHRAPVHNTSFSCSTFLMFSGHQRGKPSYRTQPEIKKFNFFINRFLRVLT